MNEQIQTLIVEDDEGIRFFLVGALTQEGHHVVEASSGEEALAFLRDTSFDLALLDLRLGGREDGLRILQAISWRWPQTAVMILTGHGTLESARQAIREGVDAYLLKPVTADELCQAVRDVLRKRQQKVVPTDLLICPKIPHACGAAVSQWISRASGPRWTENSWT